MDIKLNDDADSGCSSDGFGSRNSVGPLRFRLSQPWEEAADSPATVSLVRELQQRINDLQARVEHIEDRAPPLQIAEPDFDTDVEPNLTHDVIDELNSVAGANPLRTAPEGSNQDLNDLPRGPLSIDVVAAALGKTVRTLRGWCQIQKYEIPAHKEAGHWRFYRDELMAWHADYEAISRRNAKRAQAKRRKTKHGKQEL